MANVPNAPRRARAASTRSAKRNGDAVTGREAEAAAAQTGDAETGAASAETVVARGRPGAAQAKTGLMEAQVETGTAQAQAGVAQVGTRAAQVETGPAQIAPPKEVRFRIFIIDTGWNSPASKVLHENWSMIRDLNCDDEVFVLSRDMSVALLRHYPLQVGRDPIITVHDTRAIHRHRIHHTHGFRMHLGILTGEDQVLAALQMLARFLTTHRAAEDLEKVVRQDLHRQGLAGAIEIMGGHEHQKMIEE